MKKRRLLVTDITGLIFVGLGTAVFWVTRVQLDDDHYTDSARSSFVVACAIICASGVAIGLVGRHRNRLAKQSLAEEACQIFASRKTTPLGDQIATVVFQCLLMLFVAPLATGIGLDLACNCGLLSSKTTNSRLNTVLVAVTVGATMLTGICSLIHMQIRNRRRRHPACPQCGCILYGATQQRCPKCGRAFQFDELDAPHAKLDQHARLKLDDSAES